MKTQILKEIKNDHKAKKRTFYGQADRKRGIGFIVKKSQPDRKISVIVFDDLPKAASQDL